MTQRRKTKTTRRQFLTGESAIEAIGDATHGVDLTPRGGVPTPRSAEKPQRLEPAEHGPGEKPVGGVSRSPFVVKLSRKAMACQFEVILDAQRHPAAVEAADAALDLIERLEDQMTVYRDDSEVSRLNRAAASGPVPVEPRLFALLQKGVRLYEQTDGAFDMTSGPLSKVWGFYRRQGRVPEPQEIESALSRVGGDKLQLDAEHRTVRFRCAGVEINLGGIGKGYALDRCRKLLLEEGVTDFLLHGGESSLLAWGDRSSSPGDEPGWTVSLRHPMRPRIRMGEVRLVNQAMGTSGAGFQFFTHRGRRYGHILDPRTGRPAESAVSATVIAPEAATADALATAFYVDGLEKAEAYCGDHPEVAAIISTPGRHHGAIELTAIGLPDDRWRVFS